MLRFSIFLLALVPFSIASYCGKFGVPYSFEVNPTGAPVLGCAQPSCVIQPYDFDEDSEFLTDAKGQVDGYFREGDRDTKRYRHEAAPRFEANCSGGFENLACNNKNQWVGGIEYIDHPRQPLVLQCCSYEGLKFSQEVGTTVISAGEAVTGGEVVRNGRQISFDVIANVKKIVKTGKVNYEVTVRRMNCLPDPPEPEIQFDDDVPSEILKVLGNAKNGKDLGTAEKFEPKKKLTDKPKKGKKHRKTHNQAPPQLPPQPPLPQIEPAPVTEQPASPPAPISINMAPHKEAGPIVTRTLPNPPEHQPPQPPLIQQIQQQPVDQLQTQQLQGPPAPQPQFIQNPQIQGVQNQPVGQPLAPQGQSQQQIQPSQSSQPAQPAQTSNFGCQDGPIQAAVFQQPNAQCAGVQQTPASAGGLPTFPTLPPHTFPPGFPTLPPHSFAPGGGFPTHTIPALTFPPGPLTIPPPTIPPGGFPTLPPHTFPPGGGFPTLPPHTFAPGFPTLPPHTFPAGIPTLAPLAGFPGSQPGAGAQPAGGFGGLGGTAPAFGVPTFGIPAVPAAGAGTAGSSPTGAAAFGAPSVPGAAAPIDLFGAASALLGPFTGGLGGTLPTLPPLPGLAPSTPAPPQPLPIAQPSGTQAQAQGNQAGAPYQINLPQLNPTPELGALEQQLRNSGVQGPVQTAGGFGPNSEGLHQTAPAVQNIQAQPQQQVPYITNTGGKK